MASVWARPDRGARGPAPEHSRHDIAAAAIALADAGGLATATMRAVAAALGTGAGSLYRYVESRDELLDLMIDAATGELVPFPAPTGDWLADLLTVARSQLGLYRRHPWLVEAMPRMTSAGPHAFDYFDHCLRVLAGLDRATTAKMEAVGIMTGVVTLFARTPAPVDFTGVDPRRHPHVVAAFADPGPPQGSDLFDRTLRSVLTGLLTA